MYVSLSIIYPPYLHIRQQNNHTCADHRALCVILIIGYKGNYINQIIRQGNLKSALFS